MRVFVAIPLPPSLMERLQAAVQPFRRMGTPIRWIAPANIHLTLKFIGEIPESTARAVCGRLAEHRFSPAPFTLHAAGFGTFGRGEDLSIFWAGVEPHPSLLQLAEEVQAGLIPLGIPADTRPFAPHLTLGRNKERYNFRALQAAVRESAGQSFGEWPVKGFTVYNSQLTPRGAVYTALQEIPLA